MHATPRRNLSYASFVMLLALDAIALISLLVSQLFSAPLAIAWPAAAMLTAMALPALLQLADKVFVMARNTRTIPQTGESFL